MDKETRNLIFNPTQAIRRLLEDEFALQLEGTFDVHPDGRVADQPGPQLTPAERLVRQRVVEAIQHRRAGGEAAVESVRGFQAEAVFTFLNRLAALKMMEARELVFPCVSKGDQSQGFKEFSGLAPGLIELPDKGYRLYLECLFDEIGREVGVLFDRTDAASQLWPRRKALEAVLAKLNTPELAGVWGEDETIGWIYQYYNDPEERALMRDTKRGGSAAPRNSRELAVRNQFFTPRYVVEFLTDNTLGRIWYEMTKGQTRLKDQCRYLVRRPTEIFLAEGQAPPTLNPTADNCSQEELLKQPVHIPHRSLNDPRETRLLDPACGSMHFGLYAFDLFTVIYDEAWEIANGTDAAAKSAKTFAPFVTFAASFADKAAFLREVPRLIVEHNIHGIDIDPRAAQIAGLALWLRAQRAWRALGLKPADRPAIRRSNIVCAEPMPGEKELLREFVDRQFAPGERPLFQSFLENVWEKMRLAGEAGSLLKIEEEIRSAIEDAREAWHNTASRPMELFSSTELNRFSNVPELTGLDQAVSSLTTDYGSLNTDFWERLEERIYAALRVYAERADAGGGFQHRLFAEDAARGFAFIDVCRKRYDVVLMNPPFGERPESCESYFQTNFPKTVGDLFAMFFERGLHVVKERGKMGAITNRTWLSLLTFEDLRTKVFGQRGCVEVAADLGSFVLDAQVETAAAVIGRDVPAHRMALWVRLLKTKAKNETLLRALEFACLGRRHDSAFIASQRQFLSLPACVYGYWLSDRLISLYRPANSIGVRASDVRVGVQTSDDFRFLRLAWELAPSDIGVDRRWLRFAKGGEYTPFFDDVHLALLWTNGGEEIVAWGYGRPQNTQYFGRTGVTWPLRTTSPFGPRALPGGCAFGHKGPAAFPTGKVSPNLLLGLLVSRPARLLLSVRLGAGDDAPGSASKSYEVGLIRDLPFPTFSSEQVDTLQQATARCVALVRLRQVEDDETTCCFVCPRSVAAEKIASIRSIVASLVEERDESYAEVCRLSSLIDETVCEALGFSESDRMVLCEELELPVTAFDSDKEPDTELFKKAYLTKDALDGGVLPGGVEAELDVRVLTRRKQQVVLRDETKVCRLFEISPQQFARTRQRLSLLRNEDLTEAIVSLVQYSLGCAFGRWDIRYATGEQAAPELPDPFAPLPVCPPSQLQNAQGLPARPEDVPTAYPIRIPWDGILVDDENHPRDFIERIRETLRVIWKDRAEAIEHEACEILEAKSLRDYFRNPTGFFADHLKRYSKSRRQAPIYWPLSSPNGLYTVWLYYHRLTADTLFTVLRDHLKPKLEFEERRAFQLRQEAGTSPSPSQRHDIADAEELVEDLRAFKAELERVAPLFRPNLNDGVIINHAPLWRLIGLPKWRKDCQAVWNELLKADYDWAHLALHLWPERVIPKCTTDRSLAIAHGLDEVFWQEDPDKLGKWIAKHVPNAEVQKLIATRTSPAVKAALESLTAASATVGSARRKTPRSN